jgi:hypothetical protein
VSVTPENRQLVRERAGRACEYCGVTEIETGAELTVDHYHPKDDGGSSQPENLAYACHRCNEHKAAYWPKNSGDLPLYSPRQDVREEHFIQLMDGTLLPLTPVAEWTIQRLRLNRTPLVLNRLARQERVAQDRQQRQYQDTIRLLSELLAQERAISEEQAQLLSEYRRLLRVLERERNR